MMEWWHPESLAQRLPALRCRADVTSALRHYFLQDGFLEVETPILQVCPGMEPHLRVFETALENAFTGQSVPRFLHTSPEFAMKKLLVAGVPKLFQFARVFRNGEVSATHHPEFTMLEWYRSGADYTVLMDDCAALLALTAKASGRAEVTFSGLSCRLDVLPERLSVVEAFDRYADMDLMRYVEDSHEPDPTAFASGARKIGISVSSSDAWEDVFFKIMLDRVEPRLGEGVPTILYDYPVCQAALSRRKPGDIRFAERFELYVAGVEIANAFSELTDAGEQEKRFVADADLRKRLYGTERPIDEDFLAALRFGMPESAGIALGVDRLVMLAAGAESLVDVLWAPVACTMADN